MEKGGCERLRGQHLEPINREFRVRGQKDLTRTEGHRAARLRTEDARRHYNSEGKKSAHQEKRQGRAYRRHRSEAVCQILGHRRRKRRRPQDSEEWRRADRTQAHSTEEGNLSTPLLRRAQGLIAQARRSMTVEARKIPQVRRGCLEQGKTKSKCCS